jgi:hypothetical protein
VAGFSAIFSLIGSESLLKTAEAGRDKRLLRAESVEKSGSGIFKGF